MNAEIVPITGNLKLTLSPGDAEVIRDYRNDHPEKVGTDEEMHEFFEHFTCNSEYDWLRPENCNALTDAPILGYTSEKARRLRKGEELGFGNTLDGGDEGGAWVRDVEACWGWMNYALRSIVDELLTNGYAILQRGHHDPKYDGPNPKTPEPPASSESSPS